MSRLALRCLLWLAAALCSVAAAQPAPPDASHQLLVLLAQPPAHFRPDGNYSGSYGDAFGASARRRVAARIARGLHLDLGIDWPMPLVGVHCFVMTVPADQAPERALAALSREPAVAWAQPMNLYRAQGEPGDPLYATQPNAHAWHLAALHRLATGRGVRVAVIDSGVETGHPDLAGALAAIENFVPGQAYAAERHGTAVAGLIAARAGNGVGIVGVAPEARLLALRGCWQQSAQATLCNSLSLAMALHYAIDHDAAVINLSLAGPPDHLLDALLDAALARGATVVAAADPALPGGGFPASHRGVVASVGDDVAVPFAGRVAAPGRDLPTSVPPSRWQLVSGASYAAAQVSGLFALLRELKVARGDDAASLLVLAPARTIDACATLLRAVAPGAPACAETRLARP